jgi:signal transduction histidine kinase
MYFSKARDEAQKYSNDHIYTLATIRLIFIEHETGINNTAEQDLLNLLIETKQKGDFENSAELINLLGIIKESKNELQGAAELYMEGLVLSEAHNLTHYPSVFRNNLGLIKLYLNQIDDALLDFEKGLELAKKENDKNLASHIQINICLVLVKKNRVEEALKIFREVIAYTRENNHPRELSAAFINLGAEFSRSNKPKLAMAYLDSSIVILKGTELHNNELTEAYLGKAEVLVSLQKNKEARENLEIAKRLFTKTQNLNSQVNYNFLLFTIEKSERNYEKALDYYLTYENLKDSIETALNGKLLQELQLRYNVQKKEAELEKEKSKYLLLEQRHQDERFVKWLVIGISIIVLIVTIGVVYFFYSKKLREKQASFSQQLIKNIEEDRLRIAMDLHDDIGQSLSFIKSKMAVSKNELDKSIESELSRVIDQTRELSKNLYPSYLEKIGLKRSIARLLENLQSGSNIECSFDVDDNVEQLPLQTKTHLYRIIQECTNNTVKHAKASALKISILEKNNEFTMVYQDNGQGISPGETNGLGLLSIQERAKIINGNVNFEDRTNKSFKLTLKFNP